MKWTVDYGAGPLPVELPHAWRQDVPVTWEGPAVYRTSVTVTQPDEWLVFDGVSYRAEVFIAGEMVCDHRGIWDAFAVPLRAFVGRHASVEVRVTKNGGATFPVRDVLSGFLPYVYHTFGGIYGNVRVVRSEGDPTVIGERPKEHRVESFSSLFTIGKRSAYLRGVLSWGWYPEIGHTNPPDDVIRDEVKLAKSLGFNTIKFCLWVPRHRFFEILEEEETYAWLELPLWGPTGDTERLEAMALEIERIVLQYRRHRSIVAWTVGCELGASVPHELRRRLVEMVQQETGCPMVKDNSGGSEMYGGDLREYGRFEDFHPYCDAHFYPVMLESLRTGPRSEKPVLLGEFNDFDVHRDLRKLRDRQSFWASEDAALNDQGVRWQHDLPRVLKESRWAKSDNSRLIASSVSKGAWVRRRVMESVRAMPEVCGYVVTGWRHTPISTSGMVDDDLRPLFDNMHEWNGETTLFLIPVRRPPWVHGGNRPGWLDAQCFFEGQAFFRIGVHKSEFFDGRLCWEIGGTRGECDEIESFACKGVEAGQVSVDLRAGGYELRASFGDASATWPVWVVRRLDWKSFTNWSIHDPLSVFGDAVLPGGDNLLTTVLDGDAIERASAGHRVVVTLENEGTEPMPFWRECVFELFGPMAEYEGQWHKLWGVATDRAIDREWLTSKIGDYDVLMNRVDTRTYREHPYVARAKVGKGSVTVTTLRPHGGHGAQPYGVSRNPAGAALLRKLLEEGW